MKLYDTLMAPNPRRVRWLMAEKGITDIEIVPVNLLAGEHKTSEYRGRAGLSHLPALELEDGTTITESLAIGRYLEREREAVDDYFANRERAMVIEDILCNRPADLSLRLLGERAGARGLRIGYEALAWGRHVNTYQQVWNLVRQADHPAVGVILDSFHTLSLKGDPAAIADIPGDKIFFVQMADAPILAMDVLEWSRHFRCFPGQGEFDLAGFLAPILRTGYRGPLSLEIFNDGFRAAPPRGVAADGLRALLSSEQHELANRIDSAYQDSRQQLTALKQPLSELLSNDSGRAQLNALYDSFGRLHRLHETDLAKALDIQLGFNANDGD